MWETKNLELSVSFNAYLQVEGLGKKRIVKILTQRFLFRKRFFGQVKSAFLELKKEKKKRASE